jgi:hypothetical protein
MTGPDWLTAGLAVLMLLVAASCAIRLAISRHRGNAHVESDVLHVFMGVGMAGMLEPRISSAPAAAWRAVFAVGAAWFAVRAVQAWQRRRPGATSAASVGDEPGAVHARSGSAPLRLRSAHAGPHAVQCAVMLYMLLPAHPALSPQPMAMAGMSASGSLLNPALTLVLAVFMLGYLLWNTDQLASLRRVRTTAGPLMDSSGAASAVIAPRFDVSYRIVMSVAMGYMLLAML